MSKILTKILGSNASERFACPYAACPSHVHKTLFSEDELCQHCLVEHCRENSLQICPICQLRNNDHTLKGSRTWGFSTHLQLDHGPKARPEARQKTEQEEKASNKPTYAFALVIVRQPTTGKYLLVEECCSQGWWLPAGRVDPGETFQEAAIRETIEEAGIMVDLKGVLRVEYSPYQNGGARERIVFYAEPVEDDPVLKSVPDFESVRAKWFEYDEFVRDFGLLNPKERTKHLRGGEPIQWFKYLQRGGPVYPMSLISLEGEE